MNFFLLKIFSDCKINIATVTPVNTSTLKFGKNTDFNTIYKKSVFLHHEKETI